MGGGSAAAGGASLLGAGAGVASAVLGANANRKAADTMAGAYGNAAALMDRQYNQTRSDLTPWRASGEAANSSVAAMLGLNPGATAAGREASNTPDWDAYVDQNPDVAAEYRRQLQDPRKAALLQRDGIMSKADFGRVHYERYGNANPPPLVGGGVMGRPAAQPETTGSGVPTTANGGTSLEQLFDMIPGSRELGDYALQQTQQSQVGRGITGGGAAKELMDRSLLYGNELRQQHINNLMGVSGQGQTAATNVAQFGADTARSGADMMLGGADSRATSYANSPWAAGLGAVSGFMTGEGGQDMARDVGEWWKRRRQPQPYKGGAAKLMGAV